MSEKPQAAADADADAVEGSLLDNIIDSTRLARTETEKTRAKELIGGFINEVLSGTVTRSNDLIASIEARIAEIDGVLSTQLSAIMHHESFQKLEGSWRGLHYLVH